MAFELNKTGISIPTFNELRETEVDNAAEILGDVLNTENESVEGEIINQQSKALREVYEGSEQIYNNFDLDLAEGQALDNLSLVIGIRRKPATSTTVPLSIIGTANILLVAGTVFLDDDDREFITAFDFTLTGGVDSVTVQSVLTGQVVIGVGSITKTQEILPFITSVTNLTVGTLGTEIETDIEFRRRAKLARGARGLNQLIALEAALNDLDNVENAIVLNNTLTVENDGVAANSFEPVIQGGFPSDIAEIIQLHTPAGITSVGETEVIFENTSISGNITTIPTFFTPAQQVTIIVVIDLVTLNGKDLAVEFQNLIKNEIVEFLTVGDNKLFISKDLSVSSLYTPVNKFENTAQYRVDDLFAGKDLQNLTDDLVLILSRELARVTFNDITINVNGSP